MSFRCVFSNSLGTAITSEAVLKVFSDKPVRPRDLNIDFIDADIDGLGEVGGLIYVTRARNELDITHYDLYWVLPDAGVSTDPGWFQLGMGETLIASLPINGTDLSTSIPMDSRLPSGVTHMALFVKNSQGYYSNGIGLRVYDRLIRIDAHPLSRSVKVTQPL